MKSANVKGQDVKGQWVIKILETVENIVVGFFDLAEAMMRSGYGASQGQILKKISEIEQRRLEEKQIQETREKLSKYVYKLKKEGLIRQAKNNNAFVITQKGRNKLLALRGKIAQFLPNTKYQVEKSDKLIVVIFDIPETEQNKRYWLRKKLQYLGFRMVQKSVWIGRVKIPEKFLEDLSKIDLLNYVEIFTITKRGSLTLNVLKRNIKHRKLKSACRF
jgi:CRISPR-associated endonuclease Cas2